MKTDSTQRFSTRVGNYIKYRPSYPTAVIDYLTDACKLNPACKIADIGSGTGIFSALLLDAGYDVYGVEPNAQMRQAAEIMFAENKHFISLNGTAQATNLLANSMDIVVCAQAFHWFDAASTQTEFKRILKDEHRYVALIWNNRLIETDEFAKAYDQLLNDKASDYKEVNHQHLKGVNFEQFFKDGEYTLTKFANQQVFAYDGLAGRAFSSSYVPAQDTEAGVEFDKLLRVVFNKFQVNNQVIIKYETEVYLGRV